MSMAFGDTTFRAKNLGKGTGKTRFVGRQVRSTFETAQTANEKAAINLFEQLKKYPNIGENERFQYKKEFTDMPTLSTMNMKLLAATINFMNNYQNNQGIIEPEYFSDEYVVPALEYLEVGTNLPDYKIDLLRYVRAVATYRASRTI